MSAVLSPPLSPAAVQLGVQLGGGYSQMRIQSPGYTRMHATAAASLAAMQHGQQVPLEAGVAQRGSHLSRTATDCAGLVEAMVAVAEAQSEAHAARAAAPQR
jgi:hypothetical protein